MLRREFLKAAAVLATKITAGGGRTLQNQLPPEPGRSLLDNSGFEQEGLHNPVKVYTEAGEFSHFTNPPEITTPAGWQVHHKHSGDFAQPELRPIPFAPPYTDPPRVFRGQQGLQWFTFYRIHDVAISQEFTTEPGKEYWMTARCHAWCSEESDPYNSKCEPYQCTQQIGVSTSGNDNPFLGGVDWSQEYHIYDSWQMLAIKFVATSNSAVVFLRSWVKWAILHNDLYWDSIEVVEAERTFVPVVLTPGG